MIAASVVLCLVAHANAIQQDEAQVVQPAVTDEKLTNPHMGFIYYGGTSHPDVADVYVPSVTWGDVEPEEGRFNWDFPNLGSLIESARQRGKRVGLRIMTSFQGTDWPTPKWVFDLGVKKFPMIVTSPQQPDGVAALYEPEWWNPIYMEKYCNFVAAYGKEFDGQPWLDYVDIRCYGYWNEGHRFHAKVPWPDGISKRETIIRFIDAHLKAFQRTPLVVEMACDENTPYPEGTAIDYALTRGCWMRRDGFGPFISPEEESCIKAHWQTSLMIAENGYSLGDFVAGKVKKWWASDARPISLEEMFDQMLDFHCNYIPLGWGDADWPVLQERPELLKKIWNKMGYRLVITRVVFPKSAGRGREFNVTHTWENRGVGRLPFAYPLAFYLIGHAEPEAAAGAAQPVLCDERFDQTGWFAGEERTFTHTLRIPSDLAPGVYSIAMALVDKTSHAPAIALGIQGRDRDGRYVLAEMAVR